MEMDTKCELASALLDFIWTDVLHYVADHSFAASNGDIVYNETAQTIFNNVLDIIDDVVELDGGV